MVPTVWLGSGHFDAYNSTSGLEVFNLGSKGPPIGNGLWGIKWSRKRWHHMASKYQTRDLNTLRANLDKICRYYL